MKRYGIYGNFGCETWEDVEEEGDWVKYEDAQAAIQAAVLAERESCALAAEAEHVGDDVCDDCNSPSDESYNLALRHAAESIRARSKS